MLRYSKIFVFLICLWPLCSIIYQLFNNKLGAEPVDKIINHFGEWTLIFIFLTLSMSPLKRITNSTVWIKFRRMLGLFVFLLCLWPLYSIIYGIFYNNLGAEPVDKIINHFGEWTLIFIFLTLSMTPLRKITNSIEWIKFRRMLGLFAFFYATIHMLSYVGLDYRFDFEPLINDVLKKKFVFIGFSAWLLLIPLAITSSDKMVKLLKQNWKKLHRLIYVISIFGVLHFIWLSKTIFFKPLIFLVILIILLLFRVSFRRSSSKV